MRDRLVLTLLLLLVAASGVGAQVALRRPPPTAATGQAQRIVSFAPSVTETLFALGLGDRVVGVTDFCNYPAEVKRRASVGGYFNPNYEALVALRPDLVVMLVEHDANLPGVEKLGLPRLIISHKTIDGILESISVLGRECGVEEQAEVLRQDLTRRIERVERRAKGQPRPRVLLVVSRDGDSTIRDCYIAGREGYFDRLIEMAGGQNCCHQSGVRYPVVSAEGVLWMNPDVIIDVSNGITAAGQSRDRLADWQSLASVDAVKTGRVYAIDADYAFRPGPRFIVLLEQLARMIHPEPEAAK